MDIKTFIKCVTHLPVEHSVLIKGNHGIGKSAIVRQLSEAFGLDVIDKRLSQMTEGDLIGLPNNSDGITRFAHVDWFVEACKRPVVLFFDEFNRALPEVTQGAFQIVLDRELNGMKLHPQTRIFSAINAHSRYQVNEMDPALIDRFWVVDLTPTVEEWLEWAKNECHPFTVQWIQHNQSMLDPSDKEKPGDKSTSRRSVHRCDIALRGAGLFDHELKGENNPHSQLFYSIATGYLGINAGISFHDFVKNINRQITAEDILNEFDKNQSRISELGVEKFNICVDKIVQYSKKHVFTEQQAVNIGKFYKLLPFESRVNFWTTMAQNNTQDGVENIKIMHPYISALLLECFNHQK